MAWTKVSATAPDRAARSVGGRRTFGSEKGLVFRSAEGVKGSEGEGRKTRPRAWARGMDVCGLIVGMYTAQLEVSVKIGDRHCRW